MNADKDLDHIRRQVLTALDLSKEYVERSVSSPQLDLKHDFIWKAYSQVELAIGLAKLAYQDQIKSEIGTFHNIKRQKNRNSNEKAERLNSKLTASEIHLNQASALFRKERAEEGLKRAREARDILKLLVLEKTLALAKKPTARESS